MMQEANTLIVSDIHLGSPKSRADRLTHVLNNWSFEKLIILGDLFDNYNLKNLSLKHWELIKHLSKMSDHKEIIWIEGNHDEDFLKIMPTLLNIKAYSEYSWQYEGKQYLALHGHQFDNYFSKNKWLLNLATALYCKIQSLDKKSFKISKTIQKFATLFLSSSGVLASKAVKYGFKKGYRNVICGHSHKAVYQYIDDVHYYNTGCWTEFPSNFISICKEGVKLHSIS